MQRLQRPRTVRFQLHDSLRKGKPIGTQPDPWLARGGRWDEGPKTGNRGICTVTGTFRILSGSGHPVCAFVKIHRPSHDTVYFNGREVDLHQKRKAHISGSRPTAFCWCQGCPPSKPPPARSQPATHHFLTLPPLQFILKGQPVSLFSNINQIMSLPASNSAVFSSHSRVKSKFLPRLQGQAWSSGPATQPPLRPP